jgi:hypothetical protein
MLRTRFTALAVEELSDRLVPAQLIDLTSVDAQGIAADGAILRQVDAQPTGTGHIHSFVRLQGAASGGGLEQGYNTSARPLQFDENKSPQFTRNLKLSQVPVVMEDGMAYREFLLDVNQKSSSSRLSLDEVRIFISGVEFLSGYDTVTKTLSGLAPVFDLDAAGDVTVLLDARLNAGSGSGDMALLVPDAAFANADPNDFLYLYSKMGARSGATANGGFEEWAVRTGGGTASGGTGSISGSVWLDNDRNGVRDDFNLGIVGVIITLQGVNDLGQTVVLTATTDIDGNYSFQNLRPGTYTLIETQPADLFDGEDFVGSLGGTLSGTDSIVDIHLGDAMHGLHYDFSEWFQSDT